MNVPGIVTHELKFLVKLLATRTQDQKRAGRDSPLRIYSIQHDAEFEEAEDFDKIQDWVVPMFYWPGLEPDTFDDWPDFLPNDSDSE